MNRMLLIVDPQVDFINGSLPVPQAEKAMDALAAYVANHGGEYVRIAVTCDWHPADHGSFRANGGQWPEHCVRESRGAKLWPPLEQALQALKLPVDVLTKGTDAAREEYSIFANGDSSRKLGEFIANSHIDIIDVCGLAGDICVLNTLRDGERQYGRRMFNVLQEFSPSLDGGTALGNFLRDDESCAR